MKFLLIICSILLIIPSIINAHGGRTDIRGCHNNSKTGIYHSHDGLSVNKGVDPKLTPASKFVIGLIVFVTKLICSIRCSK